MAISTKPHRPDISAKFNVMRIDGEQIYLVEDDLHQLLVLIVALSQVQGQARNLTKSTLIPSFSQ